MQNGKRVKHRLKRHAFSGIVERTAGEEAHGKAAHPVKTGQVPEWKSDIGRVGIEE